MKIKKSGFLKQLGVALALTAGAIGYAQSTAEIFSGNNGATLDMKVIEPLFSKIGMLLWNVANTDYKGVTNNFSLIDLTYNINTTYLNPDSTSFKSSDIVLEGQAIDGVGFVPRVGMQYFLQGEKGFIYGVGTVNNSKNMGGTNFEVLTIARYQPEKYFAQLQTLTNVGPNGQMNFNEQKLRLGISKNSYDIGVGVNFANYGIKTISAGAFVTKDINR